MRIRNEGMRWMGPKVVIKIQSIAGVSTCKRPPRTQEY